MFGERHPSKMNWIPALLVGRAIKFTVLFDMVYFLNWNFLKYRVRFLAEYSLSYHFRKSRARLYMAYWLTYNFLKFRFHFSRCIPCIDWLTTFSSERERIVDMWKTRSLRYRLLRTTFACLGVFLQSGSFFGCSAVRFALQRHLVYQWARVTCVKAMKKFWANV